MSCDFMTAIVNMLVHRNEAKYMSTLDIPSTTSLIADIILIVPRLIASAGNATDGPIRLWCKYFIHPLFAWNINIIADLSYVVASGMDSFVYLTVDFYFPFLDSIKVRCTSDQKGGQKVPMSFSDEKKRKKKCNVGSIVYI